jgi:4-hydroxy-tetrahydrodipicolinate synthase
MAAPNRNIDRIKGSNTALITPFKDGKVDEKAFARFVEWQIAEGTHGLVPCGTTGESATLTHAEHERVIAVCVEVANGRVPVIAGTGANDTARAVELTRYAKRCGADAALSVVPYYNKPTQEGIYRHFAAIAEAADIPIIVYNVPTRTVADISSETLARLCAFQNIIGTKDATGNMGRATREAALVPKHFVRLSGDDASVLGYMAHGGRGCISVTSNVAPRFCAEFQDACLKGDFARGRALHEQLMPLHDALFVEASPAPTKYACSLLGLCEDDARLPIVPLSTPARDTVRNAMIAAKVLNG